MRSASTLPGCGDANVQNAPGLQLAQMLHNQPRAHVYTQDASEFSRVQARLAGAERHVQKAPNNAQVAVPTVHVKIQHSSLNSSCLITVALAVQICFASCWFELPQLHCCPNA